MGFKVTVSLKGDRGKDERGKKGRSRGRRTEVS